MRYVFGDYVLDTQRHELHHAGAPVPLRRKVFQVLAYLLTSGDRVVSKQELLEQLWPEQFVGDEALKACLKALRKALGEQGRNPRFLHTVYGEGYRFVAAVEVQEHLPADAALHALVPPGEHDGVRGDRAAPPDVLVPLAGALEGEHKQVTVLCGAVAEAPTLASRLGPEAIYHLLHDVLTLAQDTVQHYGGTLIQVSGEGFLALFGAPVAHEDHARRAVLAALELRQRLRVPMALREPAHGVAVGLGLHTGPVVVGPLGLEPPRHYLVAGDTCYVATRLQQQAAPDTVLCSAATYALVQAEVQGEAWVASPHHGASPPVAGYVVHDLLRRRGGVPRRGRRPLSRLVGRGRELALLHERLALAASGQGQVLGIAGEPGIGKSRLLAEFAHSLAGQPITYCEGHCLAYGSTTPYLPIRDLLQQLWGLPAPAAPDVLTATIAQWLHAAGIVAEADALVLRQLLDVPGAAAALAALSPQARRARTFTLLWQLCLHASQQQPLVLAVENLQWTDPTSEEWLAGLAARVGGTAILLLATYRPGYQLPWLAHSWATQVALPPLTPVDSLVVVQAIPPAAQLPPRQHQAIVAQAAGNPFFLEELAWAVGASGDQACSLPLPETIEAVLAARLDHLPPAAKRLGQIAAVIGPEVPVLLLQRIADLPEATVHEALAQLQTAELLYETRLFPEQVYTFKHALTHEVAYGSLLQERRRILHTRIVEAMEALSADQLPEQVDRLAHHALRGGILDFQQVLPEQVDRLAHHALRGERWDKAVTYCRQAGVKAVVHSAYREAATSFEQALAALAHIPESPARTALALELHLHLGMRHLLGEYAQALVHTSEAAVLARTLGDRVQLGQALIQQTFLLRMRADHPGAIVTGQQALAIAVELGDRAMQVAATHRLAQPYFAMGDLGQAAALLRQNVEALAAGTPDPRRGYGIQSRAWLAFVLSFLGAFAAGRLHGEEALRLAMREGQGNLPTIAYGCLGFLHLTQGDLAPAIRVFDQGLALCRALETKDWSRWMAAGLGHAYALTGRLTEGQALLEDARRDDIRTGSLHAHADHLVRLSEVCLLAGRQDEAGQHVRQALALARHYQERGDEALALRQLGAVQAQAAAPEVALAVTSYRQAHCHLGLGTLYVKTGQREQARVTLATAINLYRAMDMTFWLPQAKATLLQVEG